MPKPGSFTKFRGSVSTVVDNYPPSSVPKYENDRTRSKTCRLKSRSSRTGNTTTFVRVEFGAPVRVKNKTGAIIFNASNVNGRKRRGFSNVRELGSGRYVVFRYVIAATARRRIRLKRETISIFKGK